MVFTCEVCKKTFTRCAYILHNTESKCVPARPKHATAETKHGGYKTAKVERIKSSDVSANCVVLKTETQELSGSSHKSKVRL